MLFRSSCGVQVLQDVESGGGGHSFYVECDLRLSGPDTFLLFLFHCNRIWHQRSVKPKTRKSKSRICTILSQQRNNKQRQRRSSADDANRYVAYFTPSILSCVFRTDTASYYSGRQGTVRHRRGVPTNR